MTDIPDLDREEEVTDMGIASGVRHPAEVETEGMKGGTPDQGLVLLGVIKEDMEMVQDQIR